MTGMKLTFLGTSHGIPERTRFCTAMLLEAGGQNYLIDGGAPVAPLLIRRGLTPEDIRAAFVTHAHGDHLCGLIEWIDLMSWYYTKARARILLPDGDVARIIGELVPALNGGTTPREVPLTVYGPGAIYGDGVLKVTAIPNRHMVPPRTAYGFLVEAEGKRALLTGDMSATFEDFPAEVACDFVACEAAHCRLEDAVPILSGARTGRMVFYHIAPINEGRRPLALPFPYEYAEDGSEYEI